MSIENQIRAFAGSVILVSILLVIYYSSYWLFLTGFVGLNLLQSSLTKFCPLEIALRKIEGKQSQMNVQPR
ncbi:MAG: DUF2892 domain-containing protein [Nitrospiria bacterium]